MRATCAHCGPCGQFAEAAVCVRCGHPHCADHYYLSVAKWHRPVRRDVDTPGPGRRSKSIWWALSKSGPGCEECLSEWAVNEETRLRGLVGQALTRPDTAVIRALSEGSEGRSDWLPDLMSPDECRGLVSAAFPLLAPNRDLVEVRIRSERPGRFARDRRVRGVVSEISRVPALALKPPERFVITAGGEVLRVGPGFVSEDTVTRVLVAPGRPVAAGDHVEGGSGGYGADGSSYNAPRGFEVSSGHAAVSAGKVRWPLLLAGLADEIP